MDTSRKIRIVAGAVIIAAGLIFRADWWMIGLLPLITGILNACPGGTCSLPESKINPAESNKEIE